MGNYVVAKNNSLAAWVDAQDIIFNTTMGNYVVAKNNSLAAWVDAQDIIFNTTMGTYVRAKNDSLGTYVLAKAGPNSSLMRNDGDTATGNYTFDTDTLFVDSTRNRIGIGTADPQQELNVFGSLNVSNSTGTLGLFVNETFGYVGIGTSTPTTLLQLLNDKWISAKNNAGTGTVNMFKVNTNDEIEVGGTLNIGSFEFSEDSGLVTFVDMPVSATPASGTSESYVFKIDGENMLTIYSEADSSGGIQNKRIGIGTATPQNLLNVLGDANLTGDLWVGGGDIQTGTLRFGTTSTSGLFEFEDAGVCIGDGGCTGNAADGTLLVEAALTVGTPTAAPTANEDAFIGGNIVVGDDTFEDAFNVFGDGSGSDDSLGDASDVYIADDLEVDGTFYLTSGSGAIVNSDIAEILLTEKGRKSVLCEGDPNCIVESYEKELESGDLVCINPIIGQAIMKCNEANSRLAVGFVSNTSRINMGNNLQYGYPIAVAGIVWSKVITENGRINPGDLLVSSSKPGYAMKNNNPKPGVVVGKAFDFCYEDECNILTFVALS